MTEIEYQCENGHPHLTYYDLQSDLSFCWDGTEDLATVTRGGYGCKPIALIATDIDENQPLSKAFANIKQAAHDFIAAMYGNARS